MIRSALRAVAAITLSAAAVLGLSGVASANDDVHQRCSDAVICSGSLLDVHNILPILSHIG